MRQLTRAEAQTRAALVTVDRYDVALDLTRGPEVFGSTTRVRFTCPRPGATTFAEICAPKVHSITLNGRPLDVTEVLSGDRIRLDDLRADNELTVDADCGYSTSGEGLHRFVDPADDAVYLHSQTFLYDAQQVFACFDQPDLKARLDLTVLAPADWQVVGNAPSTSATRAPDGATRHTFGTTPRLSTYLFAVVAGPYAVTRDHHDGIDLGVYCRRSLAEHLDPDEILAVTKASFDYYHQHFGLRYPLSKYDQLIVPEFNAGAMENLGAVTFNEKFLFRSRVTDTERLRRASVIAHEMAHMWFGDIVTMRWWDDLWLNESFATYMAPTVLTAATRFTDAWTQFATADKAWGYHADQQPTTHAVSTAVPDTEAALTNFDGISYGKGAGVLRQLVAWVGEEAFYAGLRDYFSRHAYANASLADLLAALSASGGRDLGRWAEQWIESAGVNTLRFDADAAVVVQTAPPEHPTLRDHRLRIGLYDLDGGALVRRTQVELDVSGARTPVPQLAGERPADLVIVNDDDLTFARISLDDRSLKTVIGGIGALTDPLARALCWAALWEMTRDAALPPDRFADAVTGGLAAEANVSTLTKVLEKTGTTLDLYLPDRLVGAAAERLAGTLLELTGASAADASRQLALARGFVATARSAEHVALIAGWLAGAGVPDGLHLDTERRWACITALASAGAATDDDIASELRRDPTSAGRRHADTARAARPSPDAKQRVWQAVVERDGLSNDEVRGHVDGFWQPGQDDVLRPYAERYFTEVPRLWGTRSVEVVTEIARSLYPSTLVTADTVDRTDAVLQTKLPHALRRILLEQRDEVVRALAARAAAGG